MSADPSDTGPGRVLLSVFSVAVVGDSLGGWSDPLAVCQPDPSRHTTRIPIVRILTHEHLIHTLLSLDVLQSPRTVISQAIPWSK